MSIEKIKDDAHHLKNDIVRLITNFQNEHKGVVFYIELDYNFHECATGNKVFTRLSAEHKLEIL